MEFSHIFYSHFQMQLSGKTGKYKSRGAGIGIGVNLLYIMLYISNKCVLKMYSTF